MSVRPQWLIVGAVVVVLAALVVGFVTSAHAVVGTGTVRAVIEAGSSHRLVDVAVIDASGDEYVGDNRGAGQTETLPLIPAGRVRVTVGTCSTKATVRTNETVTVRFDPADCID